MGVEVCFCGFVVVRLLRAGIWFRAQLDSRSCPGRTNQCVHWLVDSFYRYHHSTSPNKSRDWLLYITPRPGHRVQCNKPSLPQFPWVMGGGLRQGIQRIEEQLCSQFEMQTEVGACMSCLKCQRLPFVHPSCVGRRALHQVSPQSVSNSFWALARREMGVLGPTEIFLYYQHHCQWIYNKLRQVPAIFSPWLCKACKAFACTSFIPAFQLCLFVC